MFLKSSVFLWAVFVLGAGPGRADFDDPLLQKFQMQNQAAAAKLKHDVFNVLARAESSGSDPVKFQDILRTKLSQLQEDSHLPRDERLALIVKVKDRLGELKLVLDKLRQEVEKSIPEPAAPEIAGPDALPPKTRVFTKEPGQKKLKVAGVSSLVVTPVVSADRRFVRIGISGSFTIPNYNAPLVPVQIPVPTILLGPAKGVTVGPPGRVFQMFLPRPFATSLGVNSSVMVPDGGATFLVGYSSLAESRTEFGAPVLGKIPYLGRAFRNVSSSRESRSFGVSVGARIISLEEEERIFLGERP